MGLKFVHAGAHFPAKQEFDHLLASGTDGLCLAVCFFLKAGLEILGQHARRLSHPRSFVVVSVDFPTNLDALAELDEQIPGQVYIHLGWVTPEEKKGGPALMHSKVCLAYTESTCRLWVGSHNLTASAMGGANIEAALLYEGQAKEQVFVDAEMHLSECRDTAERFDRTRLEEYKQIQARRAGMLGLRDPVLVLHAEEVAPLDELPAVIHVRFPTAEFDSLTKTDSIVHLFLHNVGSLEGSRVLGADVKRYTGRIVEDNRTEHHPSGGSASTMTKATHWIEFGRVPKLIAPNTTDTEPFTQAAILITHREERPDQFLYSLTPGRNRAEAASTLDRLNERWTPKELLKFFSRRSRAGDTLVFAPREHVTEGTRIKIYRGTPIPERFVWNVDRTATDEARPVARPRAARRTVRLDVAEEIPREVIAPYFFRSSFRVSTDDEALE